MRCHHLLLIFAAWAFGGLPDSVRAHHSVLAFDGTQGTTIEGTVRRILRVNPHTEIIVDVAQEDGTIETWRVESESASLLNRLGWEDDAIEAGHLLRVIGARAKNGATALRCKLIELEDGRILPCFPGATEESGRGQ